MFDKIFRLTSSVFLILVSLSLPVVAQKTAPSPSKSPEVSSNAENTGAQDLQKTILAEINLLRKDPRAYAGFLEQMKSAMEGNIAVFSGGRRIVTKEGTAAVDEAIRVLKREKSLPVIENSPGLAKAAALQLADLKENHTLGHLGKDGSDELGRMSKFGIPGKFTGENISLYTSEAREIIIAMLIDDGLKSRVHRINLLSKQFKLAGIAYGKGKNDMVICVIDFADKFTEKPLRKE